MIDRAATRQDKIMKREAALGLSLIVVASFAACAPQYELGGAAIGGAPGGGSAALSGAPSVAGGGSFNAGGFGGGASGAAMVGKAGSGGRSGVSSTGGTSGTKGGAAGATGGTAGAAGGTAGTAGATGPIGEAGAGSGPAPVVCGSGVRLGGYTNPCFASSFGEAGAGGAAASDIPTNGQCHAFDLIGAYANETSTTGACVQSVDDISPATGVGIERGLLSDLNTWGGAAFVESEDGLRVAAIGFNASHDYGFYALDLTTGVTTSARLLNASNPVLVGELSPGQWVAADWDGQSEEVAYLVDVRTGTWSVAGQFKSLRFWNGQIVLDRASRNLYALGTPVMGSPTLFYTLGAIGGPVGQAWTVSYRALDWDGLLGGVTLDGQIVGASSDSNGWYVATIDPLTLAVTRKGAFGDIGGMTYLVYDSTQNTAYTVGSSPTSNGASFVYSVNLTNGASTKVATAHPYLLAKQ